MKSLSALKRSALSSTRLRQHNMKVVMETEKSAVYECTICKRIVVIETQPAPNSIDIGGEAVAVDCWSNDRLILSITEEQINAWSKTYKNKTANEAIVGIQKWWKRSFKRNLPLADAVGFYRRMRSA